MIVTKRISYEFQLSEKDLLLSKNKLDSEKAKEHYNSKMAQTQEKLKTEMERRLRSQKSALEVIKTLIKTLNLFIS